MHAGVSQTSDHGVACRPNPRAEALYRPDAMDARAVVSCSVRFQPDMSRKEPNRLRAYFMYAYHGLHP